MIHMVVGKANTRFDIESVPELVILILYSFNILNTVPLLSGIKQQRVG